MVISAYEAVPGIDVVASSFPEPDGSFMPINAFVLHGPEPVLVDAGAVVEREQFLDALQSVVDPAALRWLVLTHTDPDHVGAVEPLLGNEQLRVVASSSSISRMGLSSPLPAHRVDVLEPGQALTLGARTLTAFRPPAFDDPGTIGLHDDRSGAVLTADCFGAILPAVPPDAGDLDEDELRRGQLEWAATDFPWLHDVDSAALWAALDGLRRAEPTVVLSSHLPPAPAALLDRFVEAVAVAASQPGEAGRARRPLGEVLARPDGDTP